MAPAIAMAPVILASEPRSWQPPKKYIRISEYSMSEYDAPEYDMPKYGMSARGAPVAMRRCAARMISRARPPAKMAVPAWPKTLAPFRALPYANGR
jgi:hypothetical protein